MRSVFPKRVWGISSTRHKTWLSCWCFLDEIAIPAILQSYFLHYHMSASGNSWCQGRTSEECWWQLLANLTECPLAQSIKIALHWSSTEMIYSWSMWEISSVASSERDHYHHHPTFPSRGQGGTYSSTLFSNFSHNKLSWEKVTGPR